GGQRRIGLALPAPVGVPRRLPVADEDDARLQAFDGSPVTWMAMALLRLFASAREAAGRGRDDLDGATVADVLALAAARYGDRFRAPLPTCRIWVNGEPADAATEVDAT